MGISLLFGGQTLDGGKPALVLSAYQENERGDGASARGGAIAIVRRSTRTAKSAILPSCQHLWLGPSGAV